MRRIGLPKAFNGFWVILPVLKATLSYDRGTILIKGLAHMPFATLDPRVNLLRAQALYYSSIVEYLKQSGIQYDDYVFADALPSPPHYLSKEKSAGGGDNNNGGSNDQSLPMQLRDYQQKALGLWAKAGMRGCVVLPTGSGKTLVGMSAIERVNAPSLVVVPTLDLMDQWSSVLAKHFLGGSARERNSAAAARIGSLGGGSDDIQPITVSTYDSAYIRAPALGNRFSLVIFDEVHHLAAPDAGAGGDPRRQAARDEEAARRSRGVVTGFRKARRSQRALTRVVAELHSPSATAATYESLGATHCDDA